LMRGIPAGRICTRARNVAAAATVVYKEHEERQG
jgi:hypothetical protein